MNYLFFTEGIHSKKVQLVGSISALVLLGVPWLFSVWDGMCHLKTGCIKVSLAMLTLYLVSFTSKLI